MWTPFQNKGLFHLRNCNLSCHSHSCNALWCLSKGATPLRMERLLEFVCFRIALSTIAAQIPQRMGIVPLHQELLRSAFVASEVGEWHLLFDGRIHRITAG
jgi:hypothetical protein